MPRPNTNEVHRKSGTEVRLRRTDEGGARWLNLGVLDGPPTHSINAERVDSFDERSGARVLDESEVTGVDESYTFRTRNQGDDILSLFYGAVVPDTFAQAATAVVDQSHTAKPGSEISLVDAAGNRVYNVSNVVVTDDPETTTYVLGTDYLLDAVKGVITILTSGAIAEDQALLIDFEPGVMSAPRILPQTASQGVEVEMEIWEVGQAGDKQLVRTIPRAKIFTAGNRQQGRTQDNWVELEARVLNDPLAAQPAGQVVRVKG